MSFTPQIHIKLGTIVHAYIPGDPMGRQRQKKILKHLLSRKFSILSRNNKPYLKQG